MDEATLRIIAAAVATGVVAAPGAIVAERAIEEGTLENYVTPNQIILAGNVTDLNDHERDRDDLYLVRSVTLIESLDGIEACVEGYLGFEIAAPYEARLYEIANIPVRESVNLEHDQDPQQRRIVADPNYLSGRHPFPASSDPWGIGADPWGIGADPWGIGADPDSPNAELVAVMADSTLQSLQVRLGKPISFQKDANGDVTLDAVTKAIEGDADFGDYFLNVGSYESDRSSWLRAFAQLLFDRQWAFRDAEAITPGGSLDSYQAPGGIGPLEARAVSPQVFVGVLDTSPFQEDTTGDHPIQWAEPAFSAHLENFPIFDIRSHGVYAAGLIAHIAEIADEENNPQIQLYRVLNDNGEGDLFAVLQAIEKFMGEAPSGQVGKLPAVLNLSFGVHRPDTLLPGPKLPKEIMSLKAQLAYARCSGVLVVAAAGNDSGPDPSEVVDAQFPARWEFVIAASSTNRSGERSCFSNSGDVAAPGGDGKAIGISRCRPVFYMCPSDDRYCVLSLVKPSVANPGTGDETTGHAYWAGTSFSAPMVSGLAVRLIERFNGFTDIPPQSGQQMANWVQCAIERGADADTSGSTGSRWGLVNVDRSEDVLDSIGKHIANPNENANPCLEQSSGADTD